jgi:3-hydroxyisobutyrate dehydrogenase
MGAFGAGTVTKLVTNQLWFIHAAAVGEALVLGKACDVDPLKLWTAMKSSVADSFVCRHDVPSIFAGHYDPSFSLDLCCKDLALIVELAESKGTHSDLTKLSRSKFELARMKYGGSAGELHVCKLIEEAANLNLRVFGDWPDHRKANLAGTIPLERARE